MNEYASILLTALVAVVLLKLFDAGKMLAKAARAEYLFDLEIEARGIELRHVCFLGPNRADLHAVIARNGHTCDLTIRDGAEISTRDDMRRTLDDLLQDWAGLEEVA